MVESSREQAASGVTPAGRGNGRRGGGRDRVLGAAQELFAEHGVSGTSLQMIADRLGVTKAAVYHQFHAKRDIQLALLEPVMTYLQELLTRAEGVPDGGRRQLLVDGIVELFIIERLTFAGLYRDPELSQVVADDAAWTALTARLGELLLGPDRDLATQIALTMLGAGLAAVVLEPALAAAPREDLRAEMLAAAARLLKLS